MAAKKRSKKSIPPSKTKAGRKKDVKRFELTVYTAENTVDWVPDKNEVAFVIRTSGGSALNASDQGKIVRLIQLELKRLGHKLKRKGQDLEPAEAIKLELGNDGSTVIVDAPAGNEVTIAATSTESADADLDDEAQRVADGEASDAAADPDDPHSHDSIASAFPQTHAVQPEEK